MNQSMNKGIKCKNRMKIKSTMFKNHMENK